MRLRRHRQHYTHLQRSVEALRSGGGDLLSLLPWIERRSDRSSSETHALDEGAKLLSFISDRIWGDA